MGTYINPGNTAFMEIADADYVDKTGLISLLNSTIGRKNKLTCVSRPRRFGKSFAAKMLSAYYDCSCDSHALFNGREVSRSEEYETNLNQFNVIYLDVAGFVSEAKLRLKSLREVPEMIEKSIRRDLQQMICLPEGDHSLNESLIHFVEKSGGKKIIFIIDEWDAVIREANGDETAQNAYLNLLRGWFKNGNFTPRAVAAAYMTGILPIKKDGSQSAISDFKEYSILYPGSFAAYNGFSGEEVEKLCLKHGMSLDEVRSWYDGYELAGSGSLYNPYSVMSAMEEKNCRSYW